jgi:hypothetical protein
MSNHLRNVSLRDCRTFLDAFKVVKKNKEDNKKEK